MTLSVGTRLGPYEITAPIGAGGMGEVYRARDTRLDRTVAIKVLAGDLAADADLRARFEREARSIAALDHPNICAVYDVGQHDPSTGSGQAVHFLVMQYLDGETLAARLAKSPRGLPLAQALKIGMEVADTWDPARDEAAGEQCRAYGAAGVMRLPGRIRVSWQDDNTMKMELEAGSQTRLFQFRGASPSSEPSWQGHSVAEWQYTRVPQKTGELKVTTSRLRPGYLRKNGVPYSTNATMTDERGWRSCGSHRSSPPLRTGLDQRHIGQSWFDKDWTRDLRYPRDLSTHQSLI